MGRVDPEGVPSVGPSSPVRGSQATRPGVSFTAYARWLPNHSPTITAHSPLPASRCRAALREAPAIGPLRR